MAKLTDTQLVLLSAAAQRDGGALLPLPKRLKIEAKALTRVLKALLKKGLAAEQPAPPDAPAWREADDQRFMLVIAPTGLDAIGVEPEEQEPKSRTDRAPFPKERSKRSRRQPGKPTRKAATDPVRPGTRIALLIDLLKRKGGATVAEIVTAIGWQPHSVRGAISGTLKKKLGLAVSSEPVDGRGRVYRITKPR
jgi:hypothetical protein